MESLKHNKRGTLGCHLYRVTVQNAAAFSSKIVYHVGLLPLPVIIMREFLIKCEDISVDFPSPSLPLTKHMHCQYFEFTISSGRKFLCHAHCYYIGSTSPITTSILQPFTLFVSKDLILSFFFNFLKKKCLEGKH